ncbi:MAG: hypothetical protein UH241_05935 [Acutalibacteraceae bacterium]|nr:hypothetical protein [Acutalibacteraceae bacterium]
MKTKSKIILGIIVFLLLTTCSVLCILQSQGFFFDKSPIYGTFKYTNEDGSIAKIVLTENTVYCENVDYSDAMRNAAYYTVKDDLEKENTNGQTKEIDVHELIEREDAYIEQWDFKSAFDGKTSKIDSTNYYEDEVGHLYLYGVKYPETGSYGLDLAVELESKILSLGSMEFEYVGE